MSHEYMYKLSKKQNENGLACTAKFPIEWGQ